MRFLVHYGKTFTLLLILFPLLGLSASYLYMKYEQTKEDVLVLVQDNMLENKNELLGIYIRHLKSEYGEDFIEVLKNDEEVRLQAEKRLSLIKSSEVQYLYLLYVDKNHHLRYLLDTTQDIDEKGEFKQRFIPQKKIWKKAQEGKQVETVSQQDIDKLWISMAYPIVTKTQTTAILGIDFSHEEHIEINKTLIPLKKMYLYSAIFVVVMFVSAFVQLIIYYKHRKKSFIDPLTGMYNRQYLHELLKKYSVDKFQILIMDLDHFKQVNDLYGHDAGDIVLQTVSKRIMSVIRKQDILIRYGGEEFLLLISGDDTKTAYNLAERIRKKVKADPINLNNCTLDTTISMGLNGFTAHCKNFENAVKIADECLYRAKHLGRDRVEVYDDSNPVNEDALQKMCEVKDALDMNKVFCMYQPIVDTNSKEVYKYELLVRMHDTKDNVIVPDKFLPSIRHTQVYIDLTRRVLELAFICLSKNDVRLSINLDLHDLFNDDILELFLETFASDISLAKRLSIEILEHEEILDFTFIKERLNKLQALGLKIAIDDFGSGYANYRYLLNMNIDILKIDGSLISHIDTNEGAQKVVGSISSLAREMGIQTVAEHVETSQEFEMMKTLNIDYVQGYYIARPDRLFE